MILEEYPSVPAPTRNTNASFQIPRMSTQEALQDVRYNVMTHRLSSFTPSNMEQPLKDDLNLEHYYTPVMHPTTREIITKYSKLSNDPKTREVWTTSDSVQDSYEEQEF